MMAEEQTQLNEVIGNYLVNEDDTFKLGEGAFGKVYRAEHIQSGIPVAVKKVAKEKAKFDELEVVRKLNNDCVIGIIDLHTHQDHVFIILELCDADLRAYLKNQNEGCLNSSDLDLVTECLAKGYAALYERSIIHRDIKPENVLLKLTFNGRIKAAKIGDFGASRLIGSDYEDGGKKTLTSLAGTPLYMAPEIGANIVADHEYGHDVDMWSVGVVLYECVHGQIPFDERALCRLFLFAANGNYEGYTGPPWPHASQARLCYDGLIHRLLELDINERLSPLEFHCWIVHQKVLIDEMAVTELEKHSNTSRRRRFRLRGGEGCCREIHKKFNDSTYKIENNNNYIENRNGHTNDQHSEKVKIRPHRSSAGYTSAVWSLSTLTYALERCAWFYGAFVARDYCCFSMRNYGYDI